MNFPKSLTGSMEALLRRQTMDVRSKSLAEIALGVSESEKRIEQVSSRLVGKKFGAGSSDPNLHSQPRLPGSVVGE
jgi:hypothetical protein